MTNEELFLLAKSGDPEAENQLFRQNEKLLHHFANKFKRRHIEYEDLVSIARMGFYDAYKRFDPSKGVKLTTLAGLTIPNAISKALRIPQKRRGSVESFEDVVFTNKDGTNITAEDMIGENDPSFDTFETNEQVQKVIEEFSQNSTERQRKILQLRIEDELKQDDVASVIGISQVQVSRIEKKMFAKLRDIASKHGLEGSFIKGEVKDMSKVNIPSFVYLVKNYPDLKQADIARVLGVSQGLISMYVKSYEKGKYDDVLPEPGNLDERVAEYIRNYYPEKLAGEVKTTCIEKLTNIEKDVELKLKPDYQPRNSDEEKVLKRITDSTGMQNPETKVDTVNSPDHYTAGGIEVIDYMQAKMTKEQFEGYLIGNVFKYTSRFQFKNGLEDLKKSAWYINKLIEVMEIG